MDECEYQGVGNNNSCELKQTKSKTWNPFTKQLLICSSVWISMFLYGLGIGAPTVFIPQIRKDANWTDVITDDMASWLTSIYGFSGFPCVIILSAMSRHVGRKTSFIIAGVVMLVAFILLYCSKSITHIIISEVMQGFFSASQIVVTITVVTEYTSPNYRGIFLTIKSATLYWGIWASNAIGTFFHWKCIPLLGIACSVYCLIAVIVWPESPYWLASKGRFDECATAHRWLKGRDKSAEKELEILIKSQKEYIATNDAELSTTQRIIETLKTLKSVEFYKPTLISILTGTLGLMSGKLVCTVYALDIIKKITSSESMAYMGMLILDGVTVLSMYVGCIVSKFFKRRLYLFVMTTVGIIFLCTISLYLYLIRLKVFEENRYVSIILLTLFSIAVSCGPLIMSVSIYAELIPVRSRNLSVFIIAIFGKIMIASCLKVAPYLFKSFGLHGSFLSFGIASSVCLLILYKYLPETKDKSLQEISDSMNGVSLKQDNEFGELMAAKNLSA